MSDDSKSRSDPHLRSSYQYLKSDVSVPYGLISIIVIVIDLTLFSISLVYSPPLQWWLFLGGLVLITILFYYIFIKTNNSRRNGKKYNEITKELYIATKNKLTKYLKTNIGKAYTAEALLNKLDDSIKNSYYKKYVKNNGKRILTEMVSDEYIQIAYENGQTHYFFLSD